MQAAEKERVKSFIQVLSRLEKLPNDSDLLTCPERIKFLQRNRFLEGGLRLISELNSCDMQSKWVIHDSRKEHSPQANVNHRHDTVLGQLRYNSTVRLAEN